MEQSNSRFVDIVTRGRVERFPGDLLRREAAGYQRVVVDVGAGDGRYAYRLARAHPDTLVLAIEPNAEAVRRTALRACSRPSRGGLPNVRFVRAAVETLPPALDGVADEILVMFPWGSLLRAVLLPDIGALTRLARLGKQGAVLNVWVNASVLAEPYALARLGLRSASFGVGGSVSDGPLVLSRGYAVAGLALVSCEFRVVEVRTPWAARLGQGRPLEVLALEARVTRLPEGRVPGCKAGERREKPCDEAVRDSTGAHTGQERPLSPT
ncbi:MAG: class I SAM-dependent methyltransferase [Bacillota bacterium]